jgi:hypothetical protein
VTRALLLAAAVLVVAAACGGTKSATTTKTLTTTNPTGTAAKAGIRYPAAVTRNFMRSCLASPKTTRAYCSCTLQEMSKDISTQDFARIGLSGGRIPPRIRTLITSAAHACRGKL